METTIKDQIAQIDHWIACASERADASDFYKGELQGMRIVRDYLSGILEDQEAYEKNFAKGYSEAKAGYYDKWHRVNDRDHGVAYQRGADKALSEGSVIETIIECE